MQHGLPAGEEGFRLGRERKDFGLAVVLETIQEIGRASCRERVWRYV